YPATGFSVGLDGRHVGRQYLDNTGNRSRSLDAYSVADLNLGYQFGIAGLADDIHVGLSVYNIGNALYESNGYTFGWLQDGERQTYNYYYPQAGRHVLAQVRIGF